MTASSRMPSNTSSQLPLQYQKRVSDLFRGPMGLLVAFRVSRSIAAGMVALALPYLLLQTLHRGSFLLGMLYTAGAVATALLGLGTGYLTDLWGRKRTLTLVGLLLPFSSALVYAALRLPASAAHLQTSLLFVAAMLGGYSATGSLMGGGVGGAAQPIQSAVVAGLTNSENRTWYFSVLTFVSAIFAALGALLERLFTVRDVFLVATLVASAGLLLLLRLQLNEFRAPTRRLKSKGTIGKFSLTGIINGFTQGLIAPFLIPFFVLVYHMPRSAMSVWGFASGVIGSFALLAAPALDAQWGFVKSIALTRGLGTALLLLMPLVHWLPLALFIYLVTPALRVMALPAQQTALTDRVQDHEVGRALGLNQVARLAASSGGIVFTGFFFDVSEIALPFYAYALLMAGNIYLYFRFFGEQRGKAPEAPREGEG